MVTISVLAFLAHTVLSDPRPIRLTIAPHIAYEPATVLIEVLVQPIDSDRSIDVFTDGANFGRSSSWSIEGASARHFYSFSWVGLQSGEYDIRAEIGSLRAVRASDRQHLTVVSR